MTDLAYRRAIKEKQAIKAMIACGLDIDEIGRMLKLNPKVIRKQFRRELEFGDVQANAQVMSSIFQAATQNCNMSAAIFWAKTRCAPDRKRKGREGGNDGPPPLVLKVE